MLAEVTILLAIVIGGIWLATKIGQGIINLGKQTNPNTSYRAAIENASKSYEAAATKRRTTRYWKKREDLRPYAHFLLPNELDTFEKKLEATRVEFEVVRKQTKWVACPPVWKLLYFQPLDTPSKTTEYGEFFIRDLDLILSPNSDSSTWSEEESEVISRQCKYLPAPPAGEAERFTAFPTLSVDLKAAAFDIDASRIKSKNVERYFGEERSKVLAYNNRRADLIAKTDSLNSAIEQWNRQNRISWDGYVAEFKRMEAAELLAFQQASNAYTNTCRVEGDYFKGLLERYSMGEKQSVIERLDYVIDRIKLPGSVPHTWDIDFDEEQRIAVIDVGLPDVVHRPTYKTVALKSGAVKQLNQTERKELIPRVHPAILLRIAYEVFRNDVDETIELLVANGWVKFDDPATGINTKAYTASLMVTRDQIKGLNLTKIDPIVAFKNLHGKSAGKLVEIIPIEPVLSLNRKDSRFVDLKNNTDKNYPFNGSTLTVMAVLTDGNALSNEFGHYQLGEASVHGPAFIPPGSTARIAVHVSYRYPDEFTQADKKDANKLIASLDRRLKELSGFAVFDDKNHYRIDLPEGWKNDPGVKEGTKAPTMEH